MEIKEIERLIKISKDRPLLRKTFVPWHEAPADGDVFLPEWLNSLEGLDVYHTLSHIKNWNLAVTNRCRYVFVRVERGFILPFYEPVPCLLYSLIMLSTAFCCGN